MKTRAALLLAIALVMPACGGGGGGGGGSGDGIPPTGLSAVWGDMQASLSWTSSVGAASYNVYRSTVSGGPYTNIASTGVTAYVDAGLTNGTTYYYVVRAVRTFGESGPSGEVSGAPDTVPAAPAGVVATAGEEKIDLSWGAVSGATGYRIERSLVPGGPYAVVASVATTSHTDGSLAGGTTYYYVIRAVNGSVLGPASTEVSATASGVAFNQARGLDSTVWAVAPATDGTGDVYAGGTLRSFGTNAVSGVVRLNSNGTYDAGFSTGSGMGTAHVRAVAPLASGDVYVGGNFTTYDGTAVGRIVRLNANGTIDGGFSTGSGFNGDVYAIAPATDGSGDVYVGGAFTTYNGTTVNRIVRLDSAGSIDFTWSLNSGSAFADAGSDVQVIAPAADASGDIYVGGLFARYDTLTVGVSNIVRLNGNGTRDAGFTATAGGKVHAIAPAADGSGDVFIGGVFSSFNGDTAIDRIVRVTSGGLTDATFAPAGDFNLDVLGLVASGNDVYVCGAFSNLGLVAVGRVVRLNGDGSIDAAFATGTGFEAEARTMAADGAGGIFVGGSFTAYNGVGVDRLARLTSTGTLTALPTGSGASNEVRAVAFVPSSTDIYLGGTFTHYDGTPSRGLVRLNSDGTVDPTLNVGSGFVNAVSALAVAPDGDLYVAGSMTSYNGTSIGIGLVRLNPDGTIDAGFDIGSSPNIGFNGAVWAIAMAPDASGDIYVGGQFTTWKGTTANRIVRLDPTGTLVGTFATGTGFDGGVYALAIDGSGNVLAGGDFTSYQATSSTRIARLGATGAIDAAFSTATGTGFSGAVNALAIDGSGDIYAAGAFGQFNGGTANRIIRLNSDGTVDGAFLTGSGFNGLAGSLAVAADGDVYVGGNFSVYNLTAVRPLVRLNPNGTLDGGFPGATTTFSPGDVKALRLLPDGSGRLYMAGNISTWAGTTMDGIARLTSSGAVQ